MTDPLVGIVMIAAPWIFGFSDVGSATTISVVIGAVTLIGSLTTQWRYAIAKILPLEAHFVVDLLAGALLILSPFIFGFSDEGGAARFTIIAGVIYLVMDLGTRWSTDEDVAEPRHHTRGAHSV